MRILPAIKDPEYRGRELSILFIKACLTAFRGEWTVSVIRPTPMKKDESKPFADGIQKLSHMYARLGYKQLSHFDPELQYWGMTAEQFTGEIAMKETFQVNIVTKTPLPDPSTGEALIQTAIKQFTDRFVYVAQYTTAKEQLAKTQTLSFLAQEEELGNHLVDTVKERINIQIAQQSLSATSSASQGEETMKAIRAAVCNTAKQEIKKMMCEHREKLDVAQNAVFDISSQYKAALVAGVQEGSGASIDSSHGIHIAIGRIISCKQSEGGFLTAALSARGDVKSAFQLGIVPLIQVSVVFAIMLPSCILFYLHTCCMFGGVMGGWFVFLFFSHVNTQIFHICTILF